MLTQGLEAFTLIIFIPMMIFIYPMNMGTMK